MNAESVILGNVKSDLLDLRKKMSALILETARQVGELSRQVKPRKVRAFLRTECRVPSSELATYLKFDEKLQEHMDVLEEAAITYPLAKALIAADDDARREAVALIASGSTLDARDVTAIARRIRQSRYAVQDLALAKRRADVAKLAGGNLMRLKADFEASLSGLINDVDNFVARQMPLPDEHWQPDPSEVSYKDAIEKICDTAAPLTQSFEVIFGYDHYLSLTEFMVADPNHPQVVVSKAWHALNRFAQGKFGVDGGFAFDDSENAFYTYDILNALIELLADRNVPPRTAIQRKPVIAAPYTKATTLKALELCAGAGGLSLGLQAAGFQHLALFEKDKHAAATLRHNLPGSPVYEEDIRRDFCEFEGRVDLLAGGMPCQPYSVQGSMRGPEDKIDLFRDGVRILKQVKPRAFIFENVRGFNAPVFSSYRAELLHGFEAAGYETDAFILNAEDFGVPQSRNRIFLVGMARGELNRYRHPPRKTSHRSSIGAALADLMGANGWSGAAAWSKQFDDRPSPTVVCHASSSYDSVTNTWAQVGIDPAGIPLSGPTEEEAFAGGPGFLPKMTNAMRARLQGFPDRWKFSGGKVAQARQIGNAVPPPLGMIVGLSVLAALEGVDVDYDGVLHRPIIADEQIGQPWQVAKRLNLNGMMRDLEQDEEGSPRVAERVL